jgi:hypothetical protein
MPKNRTSRICVAAMALLAASPAPRAAGITPRHPAPPVFGSLQAPAPAVQASAAPLPAAQELILGRTAAFLATAGVPMGIEFRPFDAATPPGVAAPRVQAYPVVPPALPQPRRTIQESLDAFVAANPGYEWIADPQITRVRPVGAMTDSASWLNAPVETFDIRDRTMVGVLTAFGRLFDPAYDESRVVGGREGIGAEQPTARLQAIEEAKAHRFSVSVAKTTVRGVLDAIVLGHGAAGWLVGFRGTSPTFANSLVEIVFWKGASVIAHPGAPPSRPARIDAAPPVIVQLPLTFKTTSLEQMVRQYAGAGR